MGRLFFCASLALADLARDLLPFYRQALGIRHDLLWWNAAWRAAKIGDWKLEIGRVLSGEVSRQGKWTTLSIADARLLPHLELNKVSRMPEKDFRDRIGE